MNRRIAPAALFFVVLALPASAAPRNVVIFVADGLRYASVTPRTAPTLARLRHDGVDFAASHALYPTLTTANASAIATGHHLGDTGDYANTLYVGFPVAARGGANVVFLEDDAVLRELKQHFGKDYLGPPSLLAAARGKGLATAVVGKLGPAAIQDIGAFDDGAIVIDDATNKTTGADGAPSGNIALPAQLAKDIATATGADAPPAAAIPNTAQQNWFRDATAKAVLPYLKNSNKGFVLLFWSRDPDGSQHGTTDSVGDLVPGINGETAHAGIADADDDLKAILDALSALKLSANTDVFVTADHGFSTISKGLPTAQGDMAPASLPGGFFAVDVAKWLGDQKIFDPDASNAELDLSSGEHPSRGNALIGPSPDAAQAIVAANGGSEFLYLPGPGARETARLLVQKLIEAPYTGAVFVDDDLIKGGDARDFAGALPESAINLVGMSGVPRPAIVVGLRSFLAKGCTLVAELCAVEIADTSLHTGQGMHGSFSRADTRNFMAAIGPDFKTHFADMAPVGNADIAPTLAQLLGVNLPSGGLTGRVLTEALKGGKKVSVSHGWMAALPAASGQKTVLDYSQVGAARYFDAAGMAGRTVGLIPH